MAASEFKYEKKIVHIVGPRIAALMETLGDIINGLDAAMEEDDWTRPIFEKARKFWGVGAVNRLGTVSAEQTETNAREHEQKSEENQ